MTIDSNEKVFKCGVYQVPVKKLSKFIRKRIRMNKNLLDFYYNNLKTQINNKQIKLNLFDNQINLNNIIYNIVGLFSNNSFLLENNLEYYEINIDLVYESFNYRNYELNGNVIIPKLSQLELLNSKTLNRNTFIELDEIFEENLID